jgi:hypothetical protein
MGKGGELIIQDFPSLEVGANRSLLCVSSRHSFLMTCSSNPSKCNDKMNAVCRLVGSMGQ